MNFPKPKVFASRCLGFEHCRYDGKVIESEFVEKLKGHVEFITSCPEKEIGLGIPREPVRVVEIKGKRLLYQPATGRDVTNEMNEYIKNYLGKLGEVDGFILKFKSPSCGISRVKIYRGKKQGAASYYGKGFFGKAVIGKFPKTPVEDDGRIINIAIRERFLTRVFALASLRAAVEGSSSKKLEEFHRNNKLLLMKFSPSKLKKLGRIVAERDRYEFENVFSEYEKEFRSALMNEPKISSSINVLQHAYGGISEKLSEEERKLFLNAVEEYRDERIPVSVPVYMLKSWAIRFDNEYLKSQRFLQPYPSELSEIEKNRMRA